VPNVVVVLTDGRSSNTTATQVGGKYISLYLQLHFATLSCYVTL